MISFISEEENKRAIQRLTALWALSESGLGGIMFALKIPLTGFFLGAFAVLIISLIAKLSNNNYREIIQATILVVMVKAIVSPHSSPPAYIAVAFQGLCGALFFRLKNFRLACILTGMITMMESALQKILVVTLIFGNNIWKAVNDFFKDLKITFGLEHSGISSALLLIGIYVLLYACWGMIVGILASRLPATLAKHKEEIAAITVTEDHSSAQKTKSSHKLKALILFIVTLAFIIVVFLFSGGKSKILQVALRSVAAILLLYFVVRPLLKYYINSWLSNQSGKRKEANELILMLPQMRGYVSAAYSLAKQKKSVFTRAKEFVIYLISFAVYGK